MGYKLKNEFMKNIFLAICIISVFSCQKNQPVIQSFDRIKDEKLIIALKNEYNFSSFDVDPTPQQKAVITTSLISSIKYKNILSKLDINSLRIYENKEENITIAIFNFENTNDRFFSVKGYFLKNKFIVTNDFLYGRKLEDKENGQIIITNNNDAVLINVVNGVQSYSTINSHSLEFKALQINDCLGNHGGTGFCQRQAGERFSTCYKAEKDEFCDSWISCLAVDTLPPVMLLIAAACSCNATPCAA